MSDKMNTILEGLAYVIGEDTLKKFEDAPGVSIKTVVGDPNRVRPAYDPAVEEDEDPADKDKEAEPEAKKKETESDDAADKKEPEAEKGEKEPEGEKKEGGDTGVEDEEDATSIERLTSPSPNANGGSPEFYKPEVGAGPVPQPLKPSKTADVKAEGISTTKTSEVPTAKPAADKDADGKPVLGKGKAAPKETSGDKEFYAPEKKLKDYPYADPGKKPGASESKNVEALISLAEDGEAPGAAPMPAPAADPAAEPAPQPEWEVYAISDDLEAIAGRAREAAKVAGSPKVQLAIKFRSDEATRDQAVEALKGAGFQVLGIEQEG